MRGGDGNERLLRRADARPAPVFGPTPDRSASRIGPTPGQTATWLLGAAAYAVAHTAAPASTLQATVGLVWLAFMASACARVAAAITPPANRSTHHRPGQLPTYTVVAALRNEGAVLRQLVERLNRLDYPRDRLQGFLVLEADDPETRAAASQIDLPSWLSVIVAPPGHPRTKPRALNIALNHATGDLITVYDAEDEPAPDQLREAAARFAEGDPSLACLQAPLRIRSTSPGFIQRQFAAEYAALFEVMLPAMSRMGLPFPLGGTSNHFRTAALREVGGWDPWNVTEDADLGFRLWSAGWRLGVLTTPTWETPPQDLRSWLPQRTRWIKGYMQTWGVHTRAPWRVGTKGTLALLLSLGLAIASAMLHGLTLAWIATVLLLAAASGAAPSVSWPALLTLAAGLASAWTACWAGARRAGLPYRITDMLRAPFYWAMQTLAFAHALWRLISDPHAWDKTPHLPEEEAQDQTLICDTAGRRAA